MLKENYLISIQGRQKYEDETGAINIKTLGSYVVKNGVRYITYREYDEEDPNRSFLTTLKVTMDGSEATLLHSGGATRLFLQPKKRNVCRYDTDAGTLMLGIYTNSIHSALDENGGELTLDYTLDVNASVSSRNFIHVNIVKAPDGSKNIFERTTE